MVESKHPGYIPVFYSSFFPILFNCFLFALPFPFFLYVWSFAETNFPRMEMRSGMLHNKMQNWWPHGPSFFEKKWCPAVLEELGTWLPTSYLPLTTGPVASQDTFMFTWQQADKEKRKQIGVYLRHPSEKTYYWIIAPLYSQVRLWVWCLLLKYLVRVWFGCPKDSAEQKWHSWFMIPWIQSICQPGCPGAIPCIEMSWNVWSRFSWQVRVISPCFTTSLCQKWARARFRGFILCSLFRSRDLFV